MGSTLGSSTREYDREVTCGLYVANTASELKSGKQRQDQNVEKAYDETPKPDVLPRPPLLHSLLPLSLSACLSYSIRSNGQ